jgi:hypothetical protein
VVTCDFDVLLDHCIGVGVEVVKRAVRISRSQDLDRCGLFQEQPLRWEEEEGGPKRIHTHFGDVGRW